MNFLKPIIHSKENTNILDNYPDPKYTLSKDKLWTYLKNYADKHKAKEMVWLNPMNLQIGISRTFKFEILPLKDGSGNLTVCKKTVV